ncbi:hypothetical protein BKP45_11570 [Anaerobacillus alkalidiazotrophicus]|uniref:Uncharacterized protein n=2 Tax=Anaerobacillus TaxID=704093 RepID=A0A1S2M4Z9_9BACI|nr:MULTISPECIES: hypothetical protein [Anaerobacillus]OIJ12450.1 hypothetical protein BKP37_13505 [Anaerobacillus alkalilacustris]OIJ18217.1 hypothetical protein BKP45_17285 [Anaerobacillus alkalidiazotrophicus]OIJ19696.1 hypothetical protein BKP45_11570 [Anaerobacillus alkalidiazotrophicus]
MQEIQLSSLVKSISPQWLSLLTEDELSMLIVLKHGFANLNEGDVKEIIEAAILEQHKGIAYLH